jgi:uncharacterized membrane protein
MARLDVMLAGVLLVVLGILVAVYIQFEKRRGKLLFKPLSIKSNLSGNLPFGLAITGIMIIIMGSMVS